MPSWKKACFWLLVAVGSTVVLAWAAFTRVDPRWGGDPSSHIFFWAAADWHRWSSSCIFISSLQTKCCADSTQSYSLNTAHQVPVLLFISKMWKDHPNSRIQASAPPARPQLTVLLLLSYNSTRLRHTESSPYTVYYVCVVLLCVTEEGVWATWCRCFLKSWYETYSCSSVEILF